MTDPLQLLTREQLAALLNTTPKSLTGAVRKGRVPAGAKIPGLGLRWRRADVERWLGEHFPGIAEQASSKPRRTRRVKPKAAPEDPTP